MELRGYSVGLRVIKLKNISRRNTEKYINESDEFITLPEGSPGEVKGKRLEGIRYRGIGV